MLLQHCSYSYVCNVVQLINFSKEGLQKRFGSACGRSRIRHTEGSKIKEDTTGKSKINEDIDY